MTLRRISMVTSVLLVTGLACGLTACGKDRTGADNGDAGDGDGDSDADGDSDSDDGFDEEFTPPPAGLRRLMTGQYVSSVEYLLGPQAAAVASPAPDKSLYDFDAIGSAELAIDATGSELYEASAFAIADATLANKQTLASHVDCVTGTQSACYTTVAQEFGRLAWRRELTGAESGRLVEIALAAREWGEDDFDTGLKYELAAILTSPHFIYMVEIGDPIDELPGEFRLTQAELVTRMAFFLLGRTPDREFLDLAEAGGLATEAQIEQVARDMLAMPVARAALDRFFDELLHLRDLGAIQKDSNLYPEWTSSLSEAMRRETLALIDDVVWTQDTDFRSIYSADYTFVNAELAAHYGLSGVTGDELQEVALDPASPRGGYIGHGSLLARYAHPNDTSPTRRGHFIQVKLRCFPVQPPPPGVDTSLPEIDPDDPITKKEQVAQHMESDECNGCHGVLDPIGLALENFDSVGKYRTIDPFGFPIDTETSLSWLGDFSNPAELGDILAEDGDIPACLVANFVRGSLGFPEGDDQYPALVLLEERFEEADYNLREMMVDLTLSPVFRTVAAPK